MKLAWVLLSLFFAFAVPILGCGQSQRNGDWSKKADVDEAAKLIERSMPSGAEVKEIVERERAAAKRRPANEK